MSNLGRDWGFTLALANSFANHSDLFASSMGPFGAKKAIVQGGRMTFVKDGYTMALATKGGDLASAFALDIAKSMNDTCGDGVSSAIVLTGGLLRNAIKLIEDGVHPSHVIGGYRSATEIALKACNDESLGLGMSEESMRRLANSCLGTKLAGSLLEEATKAFPAAARLGREGGRVHLGERVTVSWLAESSEGIRLINGTVLDKAPSLMEMPERIDRARVAIFDSLELEVEANEVVMDLNSPESLGRMILEEHAILDSYLERMLMHGVGFVACGGGIEDYLERRMASAGMIAIKNVGEADLEKIRRATGAAKGLRGKIRAAEVGKAKTVYTVGQGNRKKIVIEGRKGSRIATMLVQMGNGGEAEEAAKALASAIRLMGAYSKERRALPGGGAFEAESCLRIRRAADAKGDREGLAYRAFSSALLTPLESIVENAGFDSAEVVARLLAEHARGKNRSCLNLGEGSISNKPEVVEPVVLRRQIIASASEAACTIISADAAYYSKAGVAPPLPDEKHNSDADDIHSHHDHSHQG